MRAIVRTSCTTFWRCDLSVERTATKRMVFRSRAL
jgi:hypothetical protein